jgi:hypothetical protein
MDKQRPAAHNRHRCAGIGEARVFDDYDRVGAAKARQFDIVPSTSHGVVLVGMSCRTHLAKNLAALTAPQLPDPEMELLRSGDKMRCAYRVGTPAIRNEKHP